MWKEWKREPPVPVTVLIMPKAFVTILGNVKNGDESKVKIIEAPLCRDMTDKDEPIQFAYHPPRPLTPSPAASVAIDPTSVATPVTVDDRKQRLMNFFTRMQRLPPRRWRDHEFEDYSAAVYIHVIIEGKRQHCNGSLVSHHDKLYVWTTAHELVDSSQSSLPLHSDIRLSIQYASGGYLKLKWIRAFHSLHRFQQVEPPSKNEIDNGHDHMNGNDNGNDNTSGNVTELARCFDVLIFELDPSHHGEQLMDRARLPFEGARDSDHGHPDLAGLAYVPSLFGSVLKDTGSEEYHSARAWSCVSSRMAFRDAQLGLGALHHIPFDRDWDEISACGIGLFDRSKRLQGVMASIVQLQSGKEKAIVILPSAFQHLLDNAAKRNDNVKIIEASSL